MEIDIPPMVKDALLAAMERSNISESHARLIASVSTEFASAIDKKRQPKRTRKPKHRALDL